MDRITSFSVDHLKLKPGLYVSRLDFVGGNPVTTFDMRMTTPNLEPVINNAELHAIEHLGATFLRNDEKVKDDVIYFGPMGCRTGFYLIMAGELTSCDVLSKVKEMLNFIATFEGDIPGASPVECGNYQDLNLDMAKFYGRKYLEVLSNEDTLNIVYL